MHYIYRWGVVIFQTCLPTSPPTQHHRQPSVRELTWLTHCAATTALLPSTKSLRVFVFLHLSTCLSFCRPALVSLWSKWMVLCVTRCSLLSWDLMPRRKYQFVLFSQTMLCVQQLWHIDAVLWLRWKINHHSWAPGRDILGAFWL